MCNNLSEAGVDANEVVFAVSLEKGLELGPVWSQRLRREVPDKATVRADAPI